MLTTVILAGALGKRFGKKWELEVSSPLEALRLIEVNAPGMRKWIEENIKKFPNYQISCITNDSERDISEKELGMLGEFKEIRFVPVIEGSGGAARIVIGAAMIVGGMMAELYGFYGAGSFLIQAGTALALGGVVELLSPGIGKTNKEDQYSRKDKTSYYFNGPVNTEQQGVPVPLIYGRVLVGSHPISVSVTVEGV